MTKSASAVSRISSEHKAPPPPIWLALIPVAVVMTSLGLSVFVFDIKPHFSLFLGAATTGLCAYLHGISWQTIQEGYRNSINRSIPSLFILLIIGMLIAVWIASGIVPALMYLGLRFLVAQWFLPLMLLFCSAMAVITGSSWSTIGTIGVAAIGVSEGLGIPLEITAGAVVSGSFFGDKISPMSDSTNLTPSVLGVELYEHIKHMLYTTLPSLAISLVIFTIIGLVLSGDGNGGETSAYMEHIRSHFNLSPWLIFPPVAVITLVVMKVPAIPSLIAGLVLGGIAYLVLQGGTLASLYGAINTGFVMETGNQEMDALFSRGGLESMYSVVILALVALAFGGIMDSTGMLQSMVQKLAALLQSTGNLTAMVLGTSIMVNVVGANQYLAVILPGQMYERCYQAQNLKLKNLSRTLEAGGTLTAPLIPWNSSGVFVYTALGISALSYAPYAFLCWIASIIAAIFGYTGLTMHKEETKAGQSASTQRDGSAQQTTKDLASTDN